MNRISPNIQTLQISLRTFFVIVTIAAVLCMIAGNWESIICRIKYGNPTDLSSVAIVGINDDAYILEIDGQRVHTLSSHTVALAKFQALTGASDAPPDIRINGAWRDRNNHSAFTVKIGDEFVPTR